VDFAATTTLWINWAAGGAGKVLTLRSFAANRFSGAVGPAVGCAPGDIVQGWLPLFANVGADVTSETKIKLTPNSDTFHITGEDTIETMELNGNHAGIAKVEDIFKGPVYLIFDSTAATSTAGNIAPKSTAARTAGECAAFVYDKKTTKWREV
jgi:hypothetical protein